jgi:hypothetical protein
MLLLKLVYLQYVNFEEKICMSSWQTASHFGYTKANVASREHAEQKKKKKKKKFLNFNLHSACKKNFL